MMRWKRNRKQKRSGIDLAEEALYLLRHSPAPIVFSYLIGSIPFVHGLLYFWTDMSRSPVAAKHVGEAAFGMAALYIWMKFWHSVFSIRLLSNLRGELPERFSASRIFRIITAQLSVQPYSMFLIPFCLLAFVPFPMALAFFHTFSITGDGVHNDLRSALKRAWSLAGRWHGQNNGFVFLMIVFSLAIFGGIGILMIFIPSLIDTLFGVESVFTRGGLIPMMNSTFFAIAAALTYLCVNPIIKTAYVLRTFYGEAIQSGADLQAELRSLPDLKRREGVSAGKSLVFSAVLLAITFVSGIASADQEKIAPEKLDESIERVIQQREYQWRIPRDEKDLESDNNVFVDFLLGVNKTLGQWLEPVRRYIKKVWEWILRKLLNQRDQNSNEDGAPFTDQTILLSVLIALAAVFLAYLIYRMWKKRKKEDLVVAEEIPSAIPDLEDESTIADQYPEEGWLSLAREYMDRGEFRLAMRALYLSTLALLSRRGMITITKYKSNREYNRELQRKAQMNTELLNAFQENLLLFERSWYGEHEVNTETLTRFNQNQERIRTVA